MIEPDDVTPDMIKAVLAKLKQTPKCGATVLRFRETPTSALHHCTKDERHPGRHSDGERAWS